MRKRVSFLVAVAAILGVACREATAPSQASAPAASLATATALLNRGGDSRATVPLLQRDKPLKEDVTVSATIGASGGIIFVPQSGFVLVVPRGAVSKSTRFSVKALAGKNVAYEFEPAGTKFPVPLIGMQSLDNVHAKGGKLDLSTIGGAYFADATELDDLNGTAATPELIRGSFDGHSFVAISIPHFCGWAFAGWMIAN